MSNRFAVNIGFGNMVPARRIIAMVSNDSAPVKRLIQESREKGSLVDATQGRRTRAVIVTDSGHIILSAIQPETIASRMSEPVLLEGSKEGNKEGTKEGNKEGNKEGKTPGGR